MSSLSPEAIERARIAIAEQGYVVLPGVVPREGLGALRDDLFAELDRVRRDGTLFKGGGTISGHLNCFPGAGSRFIYDALLAHGVVSLVNSVFPRLIAAPKVNVGCNINLPDSVAQHYHMDGSFLGSFMIVNTALVDTDLVNGAIDVLPGTQKRFIKYWRFTLERSHRLSTRLPMKQGDVLVRLSTLWHRGMPNHSPTVRPMVAMTFGDPGSPTFDDPFTVNDGKIAFYQNWYNPSRLGRLRERTFVAAPFTYSAYRFVRSLVGNKGYATQ